MGDGSFIAFFEDPQTSFDFKSQRDFDLHIALEVDEATLDAKFTQGKMKGIETRGISDHRAIRSIYFRDPNGYVVELAAKVTEADDRSAQAREVLTRWQLQKT